MKNVVPGENQHFPNDIQTSRFTFQGNATLLYQNTHRCEYSQALLIQNHQIVPPNCDINGLDWISIVKIVYFKNKKLTQNVPTKTCATSSRTVHSVDSVAPAIRKINNPIFGAANSRNFTSNNILPGDTRYWDVRHLSITEIVRALYISSGIFSPFTNLFCILSKRTLLSTTVVKSIPEEEHNPWHLQQNKIKQEGFGGGEERLQFFLSKCASLQFLKKLSESSIFGFEKIEVAFHFWKIKHLPFLKNWGSLPFLNKKRLSSIYWGLK